MDANDKSEVGYDEEEDCDSKFSADYQSLEDSYIRQSSPSTAVDNSSISSDTDDDSSIFRKKTNHVVVPIIINSL
jgi:hypothetical protein